MTASNMWADSPVVAIVGQTATGKSDLALELANLVPAEVINADAMQFYRGMDIGTAKLPVDARRGVPHHLLDILHVTEEASVAVYQRQVRAVIDDVRSRQRLPILVGGSGLYIRAALEDIDFPPTDSQVREQYRLRSENEGLGPLREELWEKDPEAASSIEPNNERRIIRALEVIELTGKPFTASMPKPSYVYPTRQFSLHLEQDVLDERVANRVRQMWDDGLVEETRHLLSQGLEQGVTASRAVGYTQTIRYLAGELGDEEARDEIALTTRQLARRQRRWFARDERIEKLPGSDRAEAVEVLRFALGL